MIFTTCFQYRSKDRLEKEKTPKDDFKEKHTRKEEKRDELERDRERDREKRRERKEEKLAAKDEKLYRVGVELYFCFHFKEIIFIF